MRRAVGADDARAIDREHHRQVLQRDVVDQLVVATLQESRVDRDDRLHALAGEPGGKGHRVLLGNADVEIAVGEALREFDQSRALAHRRRDRNQPRGRPAPCRTASRRTPGCTRPCRPPSANDPHRRVEFRHAVVEDRVFLGARVAVSLARDDVQELRALELAQVGERLRQQLDVVAVDRTDVVEAQLLEQGAGQHHALDVLFGALRELAHRRQLRQHLLAAAAHAIVEARSQHPGQVLVDRADRFRDRHVVVVQDDEQVGALGVVQRLECHPRTHRPVADHGDDMPRIPLEPRRSRHSQRRGNRRRRMRGAEGVVFALATTRKAGRTAPLAQPAHLLAAPGQDLVGIGLVPDIPDHAIAGRVVCVVQGDGQLDRAEVGRQVTAGLGDGFEQECAQLAGKLAQPRTVEPSQVGGRVDRRRAAGSAPAWSLRSQHDPVGELGKTCRWRAEWVQRASSLVAQIERAALGLQQPRPRHERRLVASRVLSRGLAEARVGTFRRRARRRRPGKRARQRARRPPALEPRWQRRVARTAPRDALPRRSARRSSSGACAPVRRATAPCRWHRGRVAGRRPCPSLPRRRPGCGRPPRRLGQDHRRARRTPAIAVHRRRVAQWPRRTRHGRSAGPGAARRRPCTAGRRAPANRRGSARLRPRANPPARDPQTSTRKPRRRAADAGACRLPALRSASRRRASLRRPGATAGPTPAPPRPAAGARATRRRRERRYASPASSGRSGASNPFSSTCTCCCASLSEVWQ